MAVADRILVGRRVPRAQRRRAGFLSAQKISRQLLQADGLFSDPYGTRTRVTAVKGRCPRPLDEGAGRFANKSWRANEASIKPRSHEGVKGYERPICRATTKKLSGG